jgi:hypothetical protein
MKLLFHKAPRGYHYQRTDFKANVSAIWIVNESHFNYKGYSNIKSIWGFYNSKTEKFHAPVNSKTIGSAVELKHTTPYSAMQINTICG